VYHLELLFYVRLLPSRIFETIVNFVCVTTYSVENDHGHPNDNDGLEKAQGQRQSSVGRSAGPEAVHITSPC
jgi:hypothetical protein